MVMTSTRTMSNMSRTTMTIVVTTARPNATSEIGREGKDASRQHAS